MTLPSEYTTVQSRILAYAQEMGWRFVSRGEAEARRGFSADGATPSVILSAGNSRRCFLLMGALGWHDGRILTDLEACGLSLTGCERIARKAKQRDGRQDDIRISD